MFGPRAVQFAVGVCALLTLFPTALAAQSRIQLAEVLPALAGSELGQLELGTAPPAGSSRLVRRSEVLSALRRAGRSSDGLAIPSSVRVRRVQRELDAAALESLAQGPLASAVAPCQLGAVRWPSTVRIGGGPLDVKVDARAPQRSGSVSAQLRLSAGGQVVRVPLRAQVTCPPPLIQAGTRLRIEVHVNNVRASAPGEARQSGRVGDRIRVTNLASRRTMVAEIVDAETVRLR